MNVVLELLFHNYIRTGERVWTMRNGQQVNLGPVKVEGWGKYAPVRLLWSGGAIRRDCIHQDVATGEWFHNYEGE